MYMYVALLIQLLKKEKNAWLVEKFKTCSAPETLRRHTARICSYHGAASCGSFSGLDSASVTCIPVLFEGSTDFVKDGLFIPTEFATDLWATFWGYCES